MIAFGLLIALAGAVGTLARQLGLDDTPPEWVTIAGPVALVIGVLVVAAELAREGDAGAGFGVIVVAAVVVELIGEYLPPGPHRWVEVIAIALAVVAGASILLGAVSLAYEEWALAGAGVVTGLIGAVLFVIDQFVDFGTGWDAAANVVAAVLLVAGPLLVLQHAEADEPVFWVGGGGLITATGSLVSIWTFDEPGWLWLTLVLLAVWGFAACVPSAAESVVRWFFRGRRRWDFSQSKVVEHGLVSGAGAAIGTTSVVLLSSLDMATWLTVVLIAVAVLAGGAAVDGIVSLVEAGQEAWNHKPPAPASIAAALRALASRPEPVFRLLPRP